MKKIIASLAAIATILSVSVAAFAVDPGDSNSKGEQEVTVSENGSIDVTFDNGASFQAPEGAFDEGDVTVEVTPTAIESQTEVATVSESIVKAIEELGIEGAENTTVTVNTKIEINVTNADGETVQPNGSVTITVVYDGASNAIAYVDADGKVEFIKLNVAEDEKTASFEVKHFSDYYMVTVSEDVLASLDDSNNDNNTQTPAGSNSDSNQPTGVAIAIIPAAIAAAAVVVSKKRK